MGNAYDEAFERSINDPDGFWAEAAEQAHWVKRWDKVLDSSNPPFYRWFVGGELNTCYNALDRHVESGRGEQAALIYDSPVTDTIRTYTYGQLRDEVARFAGALSALGVGKGDRVLIYMPMIPEAAIAMLATVRLGAVHSVVFGGFAAKELATRIDDAKPKVIVSASCGIEVSRVIAYKPLLDEAVAMSAADARPQKCIIFQRPVETAAMVAGRDLDWNEVMASAAPAECVTVAATDPCYILYTSGTTGQPKGVVRDTGGHVVALNWTMKAIYNVDAGDVYWAASDVAECAVLGVDDPLKGQVPVGFLVLNAGVERPHEQIITEVVQAVRQRIGPVASFKKATVVKRLPKTRSGKILRGTIQKIADNKNYKVPATIDDPAILGEIETALNGIGLAGSRE